MNTKKRTPEDWRYLYYRIGAHFCWWGAFGLAMALTFMRLDNAPTDIPSKFEQVSGIFVILLMGVAISLGSALARMRLAKTIASVFEAGIAVGRFQDEHGGIKK